MKQSLNDQQKASLCDAVGNLLISEIQTENTRSRVRKMVADYVEQHSLDADPSELFNAMDWSVKVLLRQ